MLYPFNVNFKQLISKNLVFALIHFLPYFLFQLRETNLDLNLPGSVITNPPMASTSRIGVDGTEEKMKQSCDLQG